MPGYHPNKPFTAKVARDAKENQGEANLDDKKECPPARTRGALFVPGLAFDLPWRPWRPWR